MGYILRQYNHITGNGSNDEYDNPDNPGEKLNYFLNPIPLPSDCIKDYKSSDGGFKGAQIVCGGDEDPYFEAGAHYYFHGVLYNGRGNKYNIKLVTGSQSNIKEQYIKTIKTSTADNFVDVEFIFTPVINFGKIIFDIDRVNVYGGSLGPSVKLAVCEISLISNIMGTKLGMTSGNILPPILKAGIQSRPGTLFCINGEDIRLPHSGIYEIKNGVILVDFFSIVTPIDFSDEINNWKNLAEIDHISFYPKDPLHQNRRKTSGFTIDYLYYLSTNN